VPRHWPRKYATRKNKKYYFVNGAASASPAVAPRASPCLLRDCHRAITINYVTIGSQVGLWRHIHEAGLPYTVNWSLRLKPPSLQHAPA
jgi:hypothetical protein